MFAKTLSTVVVALAASSLVSAQTFTDCNPLEKTCPSDPAFGKDSVDCDFTKGACSAFKALEGTTLKYNGQGAVFSIESAANAPTMETSKYIFFGRIDVEVQAANGQGIVTSAVLESDDLDEIDWEWVGGDNAQAQSNYFSKGDTTTYDRGAYHPVPNPLTSTHTYSVEWTKTAVKWIIDGKTVRTLNAADAKGKNGFPQTPMQVKVGTWVAGREGGAEGTITWAGGLTDFSKAPFNAYYKSIKIVDYAGGDGPTTKSVKSYSYGDHSGSWQSIKIDGSASSGDDDTTSSSSSVSKPTSTKATTHKPTSTMETETSKTEEASSTETSTETNTTFTTAPASTEATSTTGTGPTSTEPTASNTPTSAAAPRNGVAFGGIAAAALMAAQLL